MYAHVYVYMHHACMRACVHFLVASVRKASVNYVYTYIYVRAYTGACIFANQTLPEKSWENTVLTQPCHCAGRLCMQSGTYGYTSLHMCMHAHVRMQVWIYVYTFIRTSV